MAFQLKNICSRVNNKCSYAIVISYIVRVLFSDMNIMRSYVNTMGSHFITAFFYIKQVIKWKLPGKM